MYFITPVHKTTLTVRAQCTRRFVDARVPCTQRKRKGSDDDDCSFLFNYFSTSCCGRAIHGHNNLCTYRDATKYIILAYYITAESTDLRHTGGKLVCSVNLITSYLLF